VFSAVLRTHRAIEVGELDEMVEVLACCQGPRWPTGPRLAVMTASGGQAELILDLATTAGLHLPPLSDASRGAMQRSIGTLTGDGNPLDAWGNGDYATNFPRAISLLGADPGYDAVTFCSDSFDDQPFGTPERLMAYARLLAEGAAESPKPFYYMTTRSGIFRRDVLAFLRERGIPVIGGTRQGLGAIDRLARWTEPLGAPRPESDRAGRLASLLAGGPRSTINEHDAKRVLAEAGLPVVGERLVTGLPEALAAAAALGYPVVLKAVSDDIPHRSELGLVAVRLANESDLTAAWQRMSRRLDETGKRGAIAGFVVQEMAHDGLEVFAGVNTDPDWGPVLAFGAGGVLVEALGDVALRPLPLRAGDAEAMIAETRAGALLAGYRGRRPGDVAALARCLTALADFAWAERHHLAEIDVNPIVVSARGCAVVDALIVPRDRPS
jgi:acetate---CoA ligase (ADP-forming)